MNRYTNTYTIQVVFLAEDDTEAARIDSENLTAILSMGNFPVKKIKLEREIEDNVGREDES